ncbi:rhodanese-like domain-containing protein [Candidatus Bathyarchaeota archaeon]|jgi:rhodanese-related sulfurtransferase|nr:rhodanese-like domain-containing protein [Candidatus Bathyarchaeota archaeon]MBT4319388.1 rhodanese-like domain-containing protein [Candidatus Bathyarchaeota archaeon]MBT4424183.1 rhodanese-like domain-containing protein [Candidatus Bathyarchaeota archaeon]MBT6604921.1 rhodanese-like domain-containing protein [Candidatus Bathyarchaeota archaeon]MBT7187568.1 rhodanese-like domain-containing protein [Candidatus Bathyarchaeota archaeon]
MDLPQLDLVYISFAIFIVATVYQYMRPKEKRNYTSVKVAEAYDLIKEDKEIYILDVRKRDEYRNGHLRTAKNIPLDDIDKRISKVPMNRKVLVYCRTGARSVRAIRRLEVAGHPRLFHMHEGYRGWKKAGHPTTER